MKRVGTYRHSICISTSACLLQKRSFARLATHQHEYRSILENYMKKNNISHTDLYQISPTLIEDEKTSHVINRKFRGSLYKALSTIFPEIEWLPWKFKFCNVPSGYWKDKTNQRKFFDILGSQLGVKSLDDWYKVYSVDVLVDNGGLSILRIHNSSATRALVSVYPEHNWIPWKFKVTLHGFWKSVENQRQYFDWLGKELGLQTLDDWYQIPNRTIEANGGVGIIREYYKGSVREALQAIFPEHNWIPWKFHSVSKSFWRSPDNIAKFLADLSEKLSIQTLDDWYRVDWVQINKLGGATLLKTSKGLYPVLKQIYPHHDWDRRKFSVRKKAQRWLTVIVKRVFPGEEIIEDYMHPKAIYPTTKRPIQLDVYLPRRAIAFEYQGEQHYQDVNIFSPQRAYQERDSAKRVLCAENNIKLIEVPFWWNRTQEDLLELINTGKLPNHKPSARSQITQ